MNGLSCGSCSHGNKPYISAYDIAVKPGYTGTEKEWIESLQSVFVAFVTANNQVYWECDTSYEELLARSAIQEVHLLTMEGRTAFLNGASENKLVFQTLPYEDELIGNVYEMYEWIADGEQRVYWLDAYAPGQNAITKAMLASAVQTSLDKADSAYQKPGTGIPETDLASDLTRKVNKAGLKSIGFRDDGGGTYTFVGADFNFTSLDDLISKLASGTNLRLVLVNTLNTYPAVHYQGAESLARIYFAGPTIETTPIGMSLDCFELKDSGQSVSLTRVYHEAI